MSDEYNGEERRKYTQCSMHEETLRDLRDKVKELMKYIKGNGSLGIGARVDIMWAIQKFVGGAVALLLVKELWVFFQWGA